jgi:hypothetical protein
MTAEIVSTSGQPGAEGLRLCNRKVSLTYFIHPETSLAAVGGVIRKSSFVNSIMFIIEFSDFITPPDVAERARLNVESPVELLKDQEVKVTIRLTLGLELQQLVRHPHLYDALGRQIYLSGRPGSEGKEGGSSTLADALIFEGTVAGVNADVFRDPTKSRFLRFQLRCNSHCMVPTDRPGPQGAAPLDKIVLPIPLNCFLSGTKGVATESLSSRMAKETLKSLSIKLTVATNRKFHEALMLNQLQEVACSLFCKNPEAKNPIIPAVKRPPPPNADSLRAEALEFEFPEDDENGVLLQRLEPFPADWFVLISAAPLESNDRNRNPVFSLVARFARVTGLREILGFGRADGQAQLRNWKGGFMLILLVVLANVWFRHAWSWIANLIFDDDRR